MTENTDISTVWVIMENMTESGGLGSWRFKEFCKGFGLNYFSHRC